MKKSSIILSICVAILCGCLKDEINYNNYKDPYGNEIEMPFEELCRHVAEQDYQNLSDEDKAGWTDEVLSAKSPLTEDDYKLSNGLTFNEWLLLNDPYYKIGDTKSNILRSPLLTKAGGPTITYPASFYKEMYISRFMSELIFLCNNENGMANSTVRATISKNNQEGLWYRWGGKIWNEYDYPSPGGYPNDSLKVKFYGLDCSGYMYQCLSNTGFPVLVRNCEGYQDMGLWQTWLSSWLEKENVNPDTASKLYIEKKSFSRDELVTNIQQGDIILCRNAKGNTQHVVMGTNGGKVLQSCGTTKISTVTDYYKSSNSYRGPKKTDINGISKVYVNFDIIRLCVKEDVDINNGVINVSIKDSGRTVFSSIFSQPTNLSKDETFAYDYQVNGSEFLVYAAGWDSELQNIFYIWFIYDRASYDISSVFYVLATLDEIKSGISQDFYYKNRVYQICLSI